ncbi:ATP-binding protein [Mesorhizobium sp. L-8-10]|uniref:AAA family ATPase n=1 Tax=unclassified Mesorhizobium TaxID=325217 RepID=UPI001927C620|nr:MULTISPECIES: AAA family ATPase [unclassified Mesorhizobium]BCH24247.1 ATP-binding protein [Mesorhizobium sp. L-8-3]BCH31982.1 ATP-binding protein [Mesorhizobium sp. L-8-10]
MHISRLRIRNIRSITDFEIKLGQGERTGWHVILGDNGSGKSSVIRSIALSAIGPLDAPALRQNWSNWLQHGQSRGGIEADFQADGIDIRLTGIKASKPAIGASIKASVAIEAGDENVPPFESETGTRPASPPIFSKASTINRTVWANASGWFAASFGPFRRFSGGDSALERVFSSNPKAAAHLSAFGEDVALTEALRWLQQLHVRSLESPAGFEGKLKNAVISFANSTDFLPHGARIQEITSERVLLRDGDGNAIGVDQMSDGYRSILSLTFELLRQMTLQYGAQTVLDHIDEAAGKIDLPGVVAVDEIDAHLHPAWQKRIGQWFVERFPQLQFFVTTHSPIICQAAAKGSVWRLPTPGTAEVAGRITGDDLNKLIYGSILDAFGTQYFGVGVTRSATSKEMLVELARLNRKSLNQDLEREERSKLEKLRAMLPSTSAKVADEA